MRLHRWALGGALVGVVFACSGEPEVEAGSDLGNTGASSGTSGNSGGSDGNSGGSLNVSGGSSNGSGSNGSAGDGGEPGGGPSKDAGLPDVDFSYDPGDSNDPDACAAVQGEATLVKRPIDIIVSIDNSGSMSGEIDAVQDRINDDFAAILEAAEVDYRVIMVSRYGHIDNEIGSSNFPICIAQPLGTPDSCGTANDYPMLVNNERYRHFSADIQSTDMWCKLLDAYDSPDELPMRGSGELHYPWQSLTSVGYSEWLREEAFKVFLAISDDRIDCDPGPGNFDDDNDSSANGNAEDGAEEAAEFDQVLRTLSPTHFGAYDAGDPDAGRNYKYYAIVGMSPRPDDGGTTEDERRVPWEPTDPVVTTTCTNGGGNNDGVNPGWGHQHLAILTGGLRYSSCLNDDFDAMFEAVAEGVIEGSRTSCEYDVPVPDEGIVDPEETEVSYEPGSGAAVTLPQVADEAACSGDDGFYFSATLDKLFLCPASCTTVQADTDAKLHIDFGCLGS